ncbi:MAG TPA: RsiV family protein [Anaerolineales bacterium]
MKNNHRKFLIWLFISLVLIGLSSCNGLPTPIVSSITPTLPPVSQGLTLTFTTISETSVSPVYTLTAQVPVLTGSNDPRVVQFNQQMEVLVQQEVDSFKQSLAGASDPPIAMGSFFDLKYSLVSLWSDILSLKFDVDTYYDGAAHPGHYSRAFTFDLATGHQVNLDQLFLPGTNYLQVLSDYCKTELAERDIAFDASVSGADPLPENYINWNISADGLVITFDVYQVAAYAVGPQIVTIPYAALAGIIDPQGRLAGFLP